MIYTINGLLNTDELNLLKKECENFNEENFQIYSVQNKYHLIDNSLTNYISKVNEYIKKNIDVDCFTLQYMWINNIKENSNKKEKFHIDSCDFSIVTYINDNYTGGELEWIDSNKNIQKIIPQQNLSVLIPKNIRHRVRPVTKGDRYSLALFFMLNNNGKKQLI